MWEIMSEPIDRGLKDCPIGINGRSWEPYAVHGDRIYFRRQKPEETKPQPAELCIEKRGGLITVEAVRCKTLKEVGIRIAIIYTRRCASDTIAEVVDALKRGEMP